LLQRRAIYSYSHLSFLVLHPLSIFLYKSLTSRLADTLTPQTPLTRAKRG
jgi:hypothetical protein